MNICTVIYTTKLLHIKLFWLYLMKTHAVVRSLTLKIDCTYIKCIEYTYKKPFLSVKFYVSSIYFYVYRRHSKGRTVVLILLFAFFYFNFNETYHLYTFKYKIYTWSHNWQSCPVTLCIVISNNIVYLYFKQNGHSFLNNLLNLYE